MKKLIEILHTGGYSCVIENGEIRTFSQRGVADLYKLLNSEPAFLKGARVADKVVGKGAAALLVLGGIGELYTDIISIPARELLENAGIKVSFGKEVQRIRNRAGTGYCPLETLCHEVETAPEMRPLIDEFIRQLKIQNK